MKLHSVVLITSWYRLNFFLHVQQLKLKIAAQLFALNNQLSGMQLVIWGQAQTLNHSGLNGDLLKQQNLSVSLQESSSGVVHKVWSLDEQQHLGNSQKCKFLDLYSRPTKSEALRCRALQCFNKPSRCILQFEDHHPEEVFFYSWTADSESQENRLQKTLGSLEAEYRGQLLPSWR